MSVVLPGIGATDRSKASRTEGGWSGQLAVVAAGCLLWSGAHAAELFGPSGSNVPTGDEPTGVVIADLDGDDVPDAAVANQGDGTVTVLLGDGLGGFRPVAEQDLVVGGVPFAIAAGDFDGDGDRDLVVTDTSLSGTVRVLEGDGSGGFAVVGKPVPVGKVPFFIATGDFDVDGDLDLAVANGFDPSVSVLLGDGLGGFTEDPDPIPVEARPFWIAVADLDEDGNEDLAVANSDAGTVSVLLGDGSGDFQSDAQPIEVGSRPFAIALADFDGDGLRDLAVGDRQDEAVRVFPGDGTGGFDGAAASTVELDSRLFTMASDDLNRDGAPDLVVSLSSTDAVAVLLGDGLGGFARAADIGVGTEPFAVALEDFDQDGAVDLAVGNLEADYLTVLPGDGLGNFARPASFSVARAPSMVVAADFDGDGLEDLAVAGSGDDSVTILMAVEPGRFVGAAEIPVGATPRALAVGRLDGDEFLDLAVANAAGDSLTLLIGDGDGGFSRAGPDFPVGVGPRSVAVGRVDGDDIADLVVSNESTGQLDATISVLLGDGAGGFVTTPQLVNTSVGGPGDEPWSVVVDDLDGDGIQDLAVAKSGDESVRVLFGAGDGTFPRWSELTVSGQPRGLVATDLDQNGTRDLAVTIVDRATVTILYGDGAGGFAPGLEFAVAAAPSSIVAGDFNGDGTIDLAATSGNEDSSIDAIGESSITLLAGDGEGGFVRAPADIAVGTDPVSLVTEDFDDDGAPDIAVANFGWDAVSLLFNQLLQRADLNGSNRIDGFDVTAVTALKGTSVEDLGYVRGADVNVDGIIDGEDLAVIGSRFGELNRDASPLRAQVVDPVSPDPGTVTLQQVASEGDVLTLEIRVNDDGFGEVGVAEIVLRLTSTDADENATAVLEALRSFEPGTYLSGGATAVYAVDTDTPGEVRVVVSRIPPSNRVGPADEPLLRLLFRARRVGDTLIAFDPSSRLFTAEGDVVPSVHFGGGVTVSVNAEAGGAPGQRIGFAPDILALGQGTSNDDQANLKVSNFGFSKLLVTEVISNLPAFTTFFTSPFEVPPFGFVEVPVRFTPALSGVYSGDLKIASNDLSRPELRVPLFGRSDLALTLAPRRLEFGAVPVGGEKALVLRLTNRESEVLVLTGLESTDAVFVPRADFSQLAPDQTGTIEVRFRPDRRGAVRDELLTIGFVAPNEKLVVLSLTGTGE